MSSIELQRRRIIDQAKFAGDVLQSLILSPQPVPHDQLVTLAVSLTDEIYAVYKARLDALKDEKKDGERNHISRRHNAH
jgi:hypothetical protein